MGADRIHKVVPILPVGRWREAAWPLGALVLGFPLAPSQGQAQTGFYCKEMAFEKVCPLPWEGTFAVKSVHGIFIPLIQPRQDLVHKFSRGNAFNKNLMGVLGCMWDAHVPDFPGVGRPRYLSGSHLLKCHGHSNISLGTDPQRLSQASFVSCQP